MTKRRRTSSPERGAGPPDLRTRLALRPIEAALALGISERTLRSMLPRLPTVRTGSAVLIPVDLLRAWLREEAQKEAGDLNTIADEVLRELDDASEY